jgi:glycosyltransferase involved in cell wall biosynthesis
MAERGTAPPGVKILMIHDYPPLTGGGLAAGVRELATGLATSHRVLVLSARLADHFGDDRDRLSTGRLCAPTCLAGGVFRFIRLARSVDVVVSHWTFSFRRLATGALLLGPALGKPTVLVFHTAPEHLRYNRLRWLPGGARRRLLRLLARALRGCAAVVALGPAHARLLAAAGLPVTEQLPLPVAAPDPPAGGPGTGRAEGTGTGRAEGKGTGRAGGRHRLVVGVAGELSRLKGTPLLPTLFATLAPEIHFRIAGTGPMLRRLRRAVARLDPPRRAAVVLTGRLDPEAMPAYYRGLDLLLLLSRTEARPRVIVEAMYAGVVVVAPRAGWAADLVADGDTGVLFDPGDPHGCRRCLTDLARDPARRRRLARRAAEAAPTLAATDLAGWRSLIDRLAPPPPAVRPTSGGSQCQP